jgi:formylglycine-generating enzyme required for sulfatase activity
MWGNKMTTLRRLLILLTLGTLFCGIAWAARIPGDIDGDGTVGFNDFVILAQNYGKTGDSFDPAHSDTIDTVTVYDTVVILDTLRVVVFDTIRVSGDSDLPGTVIVDSPVVVTVDELDMEMVWINPGSFLMGSPKAVIDSINEAERTIFYSSEGPQHVVTITRGFYLGKYVVTQSQFETVMGTHPWVTRSKIPLDPDYPAVTVSWHDAQEFVHTLNTAAGDSLYRMPTEAEWEYACRAGTSTLWSFGNDESLMYEYGWYRKNTAGAGEYFAHKVGLNKPNPWGLHDMHGNVSEWVQDKSSGDIFLPSEEGDSYYAESPVADPQGPVAGKWHVVRGGGWADYARDTRSAARFEWPPDTRLHSVGFRVVKIR